VIARFRDRVSGKPIRTFNAELTDATGEACHREHEPHDSAKAEQNQWFLCVGVKPNRQANGENACD
jgi:hypothetical protein